MEELSKGIQDKGDEGGLGKSGGRARLSWEGIGEGKERRIRTKEGRIERLIREEEEEVEFWKMIMRIKLKEDGEDRKRKEIVI